MIASFRLLGVAMQGPPVVTACSVRVGVGTVGTVILGIVLFGEPANAIRIISVASIVTPIVGLKLAASEHFESGRSSGLAQKLCDRTYYGLLFIFAQFRKDREGQYFTRRMLRLRKIACDVTQVFQGLLHMQGNRIIDLCANFPGEEEITQLIPS